MKKAAVIFTVCLLLTVAAPIYAQVYNPANGHYYELVENSLSWGNARSAAAGMSYNGMQGHLATITSQDEHDFVLSEWPGIGDPATWIGGTDEASEGNWLWITGEMWSHTSWGGGEPNNSGNENCLEYGGNNLWNDASCDGQKWYLVEFESNDPGVANGFVFPPFPAVCGVPGNSFLCTLGSPALQ